MTAAAARSASAEGQPGIGIDASGLPVIDPTENVKALSEAATKRQDDLRAEATRLVEFQFRAAEAMAAERQRHAKEVADAESRRVDQILTLRGAYDEKLNLAESKRIDAIRAVDVAAVAVASERATAAANVLAAQVTQTAEASRTLISTTAATVATSLQQLTATLDTRLTKLEQASYQSQGKQSYSDPAFVELLTEVKQLREASRQTTGKNEGIGTSWAVFIAAATLALGAVGAVAVTSRTSGGGVQPQMPYVAVAPPAK